MAAPAASGTGVAARVTWKSFITRSAPATTTTGSPSMGLPVASAWFLTLSVSRRSAHDGAQPLPQPGSEHRQDEERKDVTEGEVRWVRQRAPQSHQHPGERADGDAARGASGSGRDR